MREGNKIGIGGDVEVKGGLCSSVDVGEYLEKGERSKILFYAIN